MSLTDIVYSCKQCSWSFSLKNNKVCPMCKTPPEIDMGIIVETVQEYSRRKGVFIKKKEAKSLVSSFKKRYKRLPSFKEIWTLADKVTLQKGVGAKVSLEDKIAKKMSQMQDKDTAKAARKKELKAKRGVEKVEDSGAKCPSCGNLNPADSRFCLDCGAKLSETGVVKATENVSQKHGLKCQQCGHVNSTSVNECVKCGNVLKLGDYTGELRKQMEYCVFHKGIIFDIADERSCKKCKTSMCADCVQQAGGKCPNCGAKM